MCFWDGSLNYILIHFAHIFDECVSLPGWWVMRSRYIFQFFHFFHFVATHVFWWKIYLFALLLLLLLLCFSVVSFFLLFSFHFVELIQCECKKKQKENPTMKNWKQEREKKTIHRNWLSHTDSVCIFRSIFPQLVTHIELKTRLTA